MENKNALILGFASGVIGLYLGFCSGYYKFLTDKVYAPQVEGDSRQFIVVESKTGCKTPFVKQGDQFVRLNQTQTSELSTRKAELSDLQKKVLDATK